MTWWADANARARGLAGHLLDAPAWRRLFGAPDLPGLCRELQRSGYPVEPGVDARTAERAVEQVRFQRQDLLVRWLGSRAQKLRIVLEADDRRAIRTLLRGAATDLGPEERLATVPLTCGVSEDMLRATTASSSPEGCVEVLAELGQPLALRTMEEHHTLTENWPGLTPLLALELALAHAWAARVREEIGRRDSHLREYAGLVVDLENAWGALEPAAGDGPPAEAVFVKGGATLSLESFSDARDAGSRDEARELLGRVLPGAVGELFADATVPSTLLERGALELAVRHEERALRREPLGPAPLLAFLLRLRLESRDLRGLLWARALGAPPGATGIT